MDPDEFSSKLIQRIEEVSNPGGNIDLDSSDDSIVIGTGENTIDFQVASDLTNRIKSIQYVENPGWNINLVSSNGSIGITPDDGGNEIDIEVSSDALGVQSLHGVENPGGNIDIQSP